MDVELALGFLFGFGREGKLRCFPPLPNRTELGTRDSEAKFWVTTFIDSSLRSVALKGEVGGLGKEGSEVMVVWQGCSDEDTGDSRCGAVSLTNVGD